MEISLGQKITIEEIKNHEYLLTNGLGGYTFNSLWQANMRKYHSLYTVSLAPPVKRLHVVTKMAETLTIGEKEYRLDLSYQGEERSYHSYLKKVERRGYLLFTYEGPGFKVLKRLAFKRATNALVISYELLVEQPYSFKVTPYLHMRDHHDVEDLSMESYKVIADVEGLVFKKDEHQFYIASNTSYVPEKRLSEPLYYVIETERGYPHEEVHFIPGDFFYESDQQRDELKFIISDQFENLDPNEIMEEAYKRYMDLKEASGFELEAMAELAAFSEDFLVKRDTIDSMTILAGYPWFTDWGRDTMISLPGLTLVLKKFHEAKSILMTFLKNMQSGLIPNNFPDEGQDPMYNTADGTLWIFEAVQKYLTYSEDYESAKDFLPYLEDIISAHVEGTVNKIYMDEDYLLSAGDEGTQLTWMDVKVNGWVPTKRHGKAVEVNALWYNALMIMAELSDGEKQAYYKSLSNKVFDQFNKTFWYEEGQYLYDVVNEKGHQEVKRPNQIFALSLTYPVLKKAYQKAVVDFVQEEFLTPYGLRTLNCDDPDYHGKYFGLLEERDGAYHRGTVWMWLLGPYLNAHYLVYQDHDYVEEKIMGAMAHIHKGVLGSLAEIFDGDLPYEYRGCPAQAWSVAEILRVYKEICSICK